MKGYTHITNEISRDEAKRFAKLVPDRIVGRPQATETYTTEQLEKMGLVGVFERTESYNKRMDAYKEAAAKDGI